MTGISGLIPVTVDDKRVIQLGLYDVRKLVCTHINKYTKYRRMIGKFIDTLLDS